MYIVVAAARKSGVRQQSPSNKKTAARQAAVFVHGRNLFFCSARGKRDGIRQLERDHALRCERNVAIVARKRCSGCTGARSQQSTDQRTFAAAGQSADQST